MGCDAPLGGPTKLLRKILFLPPDSNSQLPRIYTSAFDMSWGARVAVAFGEMIMLYSIPPDICNLSRIEQKVESWDMYRTPPFSNEGRMADHWLNWWDEPHPSSRWGNHPVWPIAIRGAEIGSLKGVSELAIHTTPDITIWGFTSDFRCKTWQLRNSTEPVPSLHRYVCHSGIVHNAYPENEAPDDVRTESLFIHSSRLSTPVSAPPDDIEPHASIGFDGHSSQVLPREEERLQVSLKRLVGALSTENDEWVDLIDVRGCDAWYERNGDIWVSPLNSGGGSLQPRVGDVEGWDSRNLEGV